MLEDVDIAAPIGREVLVDVQASGLCHTDLLFATHDFVPMPAVLGHEVAGVVAASRSRRRADSVSEITSSALSRSRAVRALDVYPAAPSSADIRSRRCADRPMPRA